MKDEDKRRSTLDPPGNGSHDRPAIVEQWTQRARQLENIARVERHIEEMKYESEILLESTRHYVQPDPEDLDSVYDTCDVLGPWDTLNDAEKRAALDELDWRGISPEDKQRVVERELSAGQPERQAEKIEHASPAVARESPDLPKPASELANYRSKPDDKSRDR